VAQYVFTMNRVGKIVPPKLQILKTISLGFFPGAKIGVLGLNGSGKSTLLEIMAGIDKDIEGEATPMPGLEDRKFASSEESVGESWLRELAEHVMQKELGIPECPIAARFSRCDFGLVVPPLDDAVGELLFGPEIVEQ